MSGASTFPFDQLPRAILRQICLLAGAQGAASLARSSRVGLDAIDQFRMIYCERYGFTTGGLYQHLEARAFYNKMGQSIRVLAKGGHIPARFVVREGETIDALHTLEAFEHIPADAFLAALAREEVLQGALGPLLAIWRRRDFEAAHTLRCAEVCGQHLSTAVEKGDVTASRQILNILVQSLERDQVIELITPHLHASVVHGSTDLVLSFLRAGAPINSLHEGKGLLHRAIEANCPTVVTLLCDHGINRALKDSQGKTARTLGKSSGRNEAYFTLIEHDDDDDVAPIGGEPNPNHARWDQMRAHAKRFGWVPLPGHNESMQQLDAVRYWEILERECSKLVSAESRPTRPSHLQGVHWPRHQIIGCTFRDDKLVYPYTEAIDMLGHAETTATDVIVESIRSFSQQRKGFFLSAALSILCRQVGDGPPRTLRLLCGGIDQPQTNPYLLASWNGWPRLVHLLHRLDFGPPIDQAEAIDHRFEGQKTFKWAVAPNLPIGALEVAVIRDNPHVVRALCQSGTRPANAQVAVGKSAPMLAICAGRVRCLEELLAHSGLRPDVQLPHQDYTVWDFALHRSRQHPDGRILFPLLRAGADPNRIHPLEGATPLTPLHIANQLRDFRCVKLLLECGAAPTGADYRCEIDDRELSPWEHAIHLWIDDPKEEASQRLLATYVASRTVDLEAPLPGFDQAPTLLHLAARHNAVKVARSLLRLRVEMQVYDTKGRTPLMVAMRKGAHKVTALLMANRKGRPDPRYIQKTSIDAGGR